MQVRFGFTLWLAAVAMAEDAGYRVLRCRPAAAWTS